VTGLVLDRAVNVTAISDGHAKHYADVFVMPRFSCSPFPILGVIGLVVPTGGLSCLFHPVAVLRLR
jgi:hypothetical protein